MTVVLLDFESRSLADLKVIGGRLYWEHSSTLPLCCVLHRTDTNERLLWLPGDANPLRPGDVYAAHNATGFDRFACIRLGWRTLADPWIDTSELARVAGLPGSLDALATRWLGTEKDATGSAVTRSLSGTRRLAGVPPELAPSFKTYHKALKANPAAWPDVPTDIYERVIQYCDADVDVLEHGWPLLQEWEGLDGEVPRVDRAVNDRGILFDRALARRLLEEDERNAEAACEECAREMGDYTADEIRAAATSPAHFVLVTGAENAQAATVAELDHPLARAREALASIARGKLRAGLARASADGRIRDSHRYYGAHTGRWSGRGMQLQNMPRPGKRFEEWGDAEVCALADAVLAGGRAKQDEVDLLLRATLCAAPGNVLIWQDFSGVESRFTAWAARDEPALDTFRSGRDPYKVAAAAIYGVPYEAVDKVQRQVGKVAELALGYQGGVNALIKMAKPIGLDMSTLPISPQEIVDRWRAAHSPTVAFWRALNEAFLDACRGRASHVGPFEFCPSEAGDYVAMILPSGRPVVYRDVTVEVGEYGPSASYQSERGWRQHVYGGLLCENGVQAACRDAMAAAMVEAEDLGLPVVLSVHDEIVCEVPEEIAEDCENALHGIMVEVLSRLEGFPAAAAGGRGRRYRK